MEALAFLKIFGGFGGSWWIPFGCEILLLLPYIDIMYGKDEFRELYRW